MNEENRNPETGKNDLTADSDNSSAFSMPQRKPGGLYSNVKMSVRTANILVIICIVALLAVTVFLISHNGFTVSFNTDGGSSVESIKLYYGDVIPDVGTPVKEGYIFTGWYADQDGKVPWDLENDTVTGSLTLYAGWEEAQKNVQ